jgi:hypothetical protein
VVVYFDWEVCSREGVLASRHFVKHDTEGPNVTWIRVVQTLKSLRRHVAQSTGVRACVFVHCWTVISISKLFADAEVAKFCNTKSRFDQNVIGLYVSVDLLSFVVQVIQRLKNVPRKACDHKFWNQRFDQSVGWILTLLFNSYDCLEATAVHVLHY